MSILIIYMQILFCYNLSIVILTKIDEECCIIFKENSSLLTPISQNLYKWISPIFFSRPTLFERILFDRVILEKLLA